jgi:hypothetical protein
MLQATHRAWRGGLLLVVVAFTLAAAPAGARATDLDVRVVSGAAVAGAALELKGSGLAGRGLRVTVGGKRARTFRARGRLRFVVPKVRPGVRKLVVRRGRHSASARLRVLRPFRGKVTVKADRRRAESATIGPAGGAVTARGADGTRYTLRVPAGGLTAEREITVTPVLRFEGLPFTGGRVAGVEFGPDGLRFETPATLEIEPRRALPANIAGFAYAPGASGFEVEPATRTGGSVTLQVEHFSSSGAGAITAADFANVVGPIISRPGPLSESQIRSIIGLIGEWSARFSRPVDFCTAQPICGQAQLKALDSLAVIAADVCTHGRAQPTLGSVNRLIQLEGLRQEVGAFDNPSGDCQRQILASVIGLATFAARSDPRGVPPFQHELPRTTFGDIDGNGFGASWEVLLELAAFAFQLAFVELGDSARDDALSILRDLPAQARIRCDSDLDDAVHLLLTGRRWAELRDADSLATFNTGLDFCRLAVEATPGRATVAPGSQRQFTATVSGLIDDSSNADVTWAASRGRIDASGHYTAPSTPGSDQVTATSVLNPSRTATSQITVAGDCGSFPTSVQLGAASSFVSAFAAGSVEEMESSAPGFSATAERGSVTDGSRASARLSAGAGIDPCTGGGSVSARGLTTQLGPGTTRTRAFLSRSFTLTESVPYALTWNARGIRTGGSPVRRFFLQLAQPGSVAIVADSSPRRDSWRATGIRTGTLEPGTYKLDAESDCRVSRCRVDWRVQLEVGGDVDAVPVAITDGPADITDETTALFEFAVLGGSPPAGRFECSLDGAAFAACTSSHALSGLTDGEHVLAVRFVPESGTPGAPSQERWTVDTEPPAVVVDQAPSGTGNPPDAEVAFHAVEPDGTTSDTAAFECAEDSLPPSECASPHVVTGLAPGSHSFTVVATDPAGNVSAPRTVTWSVGPT